MRLQVIEQKHIKRIAEQVFGVGSQVMLFGSRINDNLKGGDIDLYIQPTDNQFLYQKKISFLVELKLALGDQKIDVIVERDRSRLIEQEALTTGVLL